MQRRSVVSPLLGAVCTVVGDARGRCVVVDPGAGVADDVRAVVAREGWRPVAVLLTHGHVDHTWCAAELADGWGVPVHVHAGDVARLHDPVGTLGPLGAQLAAMAGQDVPDAPREIASFTPPPDGGAAVLSGPDGEPLLADDDGDPATALRALHLPGHTEGSTAYLVDADGPVALTGDVLFAGTIGRTDLPGGDADAMAASLRVLARLEPATRVVPGHGPESTIAAELTSNPYLRAAR